MPRRKALQLEQAALPLRGRKVLQSQQGELPLLARLVLRKTVVSFAQLPLERGSSSCCFSRTQQGGLPCPPDWWGGEITAGAWELQLL